MKSKNKSSARQYAKLHPAKALGIKKAIKRGLKEYEETFRKLAAV